MATETACPYCYHRIDLAGLHFQCTGRAVPGRERCRKQVDEERRRLTGYAGASLPTFPPPEWRRLPGREPPRLAPCPACGHPTGLRACQICRTPLPANFADGPTPLIGMVGGKNAGKTVYTTVLAHELRHNIRKRFDADIWFAGDQQHGDGTVADWLKKYENALFDMSQLPEQTLSALDGIKIPLVLQWRQPQYVLGREIYKTTTLSFYDTAGEDMINQEVVNDQAYLNSADGLIVLLDPFQLRGSHDRISLPASATRDSEPPIRVLAMITNSLRASGGVRGRRKISIPVAVVFSKIDAFFATLGEGHPLRHTPRADGCYDEVAGQNTDEHMRALLTDLDAGDIDAHLRYHYSKFRYFAVSSLGAQPDYARGLVGPGGVRPFRVDEPLLWLLSHFKVIRRGH